MFQCYYYFYFIVFYFASQVHLFCNISWFIFYIVSCYFDLSLLWVFWFIIICFIYIYIYITKYIERERINIYLLLKTHTYAYYINFIILYIFIYKFYGWRIWLFLISIIYLISLFIIWNKNFFSTCTWFHQFLPIIV